MINLPATHAMTESVAASISAERSADNVLVVTVAGRWSLHDSAPSCDNLWLEFGREPSPREVRLDMTQLGQSDSSLISLLVDLAKACQAKGVRFDRRGVPDAVLQLVNMALAVPDKKTRQPPNRELFFTRIGKAGLTLGASVMEVYAFIGICALSFWRMLWGRAVFRRGDVWVIIQRCGAEALPIVTLINFLIGIILGFIGGVELRKFGATVYMADLVGLAMVRELGCLMTGIIMSGRTGAAFAAEIGSMKANQEIDALKTLGLSPIDFLVMPRMLALLVMMPLLTVYGNIVGMVGGAMVAPAFGISLMEYYQQITGAIDLPNYFSGIVKSFFFGAIVAGAGCLKGVQSGRSSSAVGLATTSAVVTSITAIIILDAIFAVVLSSLGI